MQNLPCDDRGHVIEVSDRSTSLIHDYGQSERKEWFPVAYSAKHSQEYGGNVRIGLGRIQQRTNRLGTTNRRKVLIDLGRNGHKSMIFIWDLSGKKYVSISDESSKNRIKCTINDIT